jgi:hypothetical protein
MKKIIALIAIALLATPLAMAQTETGTSAGARALDQARSGAISAGRTTTETITVSDYETAGGKEIVVVEEDEKWWSVNASTGWDSLYMFRGVNVLGNGNGIYWLGGDVGVSPWENGTITAGLWYGVGSWWNGANTQSRYGELDLFANYTHTFGALSLTAGWIYYYYPNSPAAPQNGESWTSQNEIMFGAAYDIEVGSVTFTPNLTYYYNVGPEYGTANGIANGGSSYLLLQLDASVPVAYDGAVALEPYTAVGFNFGFNTRYSDGAYNRFNGGNNWQTGVALPIQFTSWLSISPYLAYSYQWQNLPTYADLGNPQDTAVNSWWAGISANLSF